MVGVEVVFPYPPSNKPMFQLQLSLGRAPPNSGRTFPHFGLSFSPPLFAIRGLLSWSLWVIHSYYTPGPTFVGNRQAEQTPCLVFPPRNLVSRLFECHCCLVRNQRPSCLTSLSLSIWLPPLRMSWKKESHQLTSSMWSGRPIKHSAISWPNFLLPLPISSSNH